jgi:hypothetical protein
LDAERPLDAVRRLGAAFLAFGVLERERERERERDRARRADLKGRITPGILYFVLLSEDNKYFFG